MNKSIFLSALVIAGCSSDGSGTNTTCGTGTMLQDGMCVPTGTGDNTTCGAGTHLMGTMCVPDSNSTASAPTVASIDPPHAGVSGNVLFTITGTGFVGSNVTSLDVWFGDTTNMYCKATLGAANATTIAGEVPGACDLNVDVTVQTNVGMATIPFHYDALFAADGDAGGQYGAAGDIYIIDPFAQVSFDLGPLNDGISGYGISGMDFDAAGTLWAVTTGDSPGDNFVSQLVTIDPLSATVTVIGNTVDAAAHDYYITDIKMVGTTLYGWGYHSNMRGLVTINTATGAVTPVGAGQTDTYPYISGSLVVDGTGALLVSTNAAAPDANVGSTGDFSTVNMGTGSMASMVTLDYWYGAPIEAMTTYGTGSSAVLLGAVDDGQYGMSNDPLAPTNFGVTLTTIDPNADTSMPNTYITNPVFELPAQIGQQSHIDALAIPPTSVVLARQLPHALWSKLAVAPSHAAHPARHGHL